MEGIILTDNIDDCYTEDFIAKVNEHSFTTSSDFSNELFLYFYLKFSEYCAILGKGLPLQGGMKRSIVDSAIVVRARKACNDEDSFTKILLLNTKIGGQLIIYLLQTLALSILLPLYFLWKTRKYDSISQKKEKLQFIYLIRSEASYRKCKFSIDEVKSAMVLVDNWREINVVGHPIYAAITLGNVLKVTFETLLYSIRDIRAFFIDGNRMLGISCSAAILSFYSKRISHKAIYEACLTQVLRLHPGATFITGDKDDRFALMQTRVCKKADVNLICLPHGLEYGFNFPGGLAGTIFFCLAEESANFLSSLYKSKKFLYSEEIARSMCGVNIEAAQAQKISRCCFFTEPRDPQVNYAIIEYFRMADLEISIKLHPLENAAIYSQKFPDVNQIADYSEAIRSSVCVARKSSVLLEASMRGSAAIAALVAKKDRVYVEKIFPSLLSSAISRAYNYAELSSLVKGE